MYTLFFYVPTTQGDTNLCQVTHCLELSFLLFAADVRLCATIRASLIHSFLLIFRTLFQQNVRLGSFSRLNFLKLNARTKFGV